MCLNAQWLVRLSVPALRNAPLISAPAATTLGAMKNRFPIDRRPTWRQRFLAIAREMEAQGAPRRESIAAVQAARHKSFPSRILRGIRLGCARTA
jgi:hypothetical protein